MSDEKQEQGLIYFDEVTRFTIEDFERIRERLRRAPPVPTPPRALLPEASALWVEPEARPLTMRQMARAWWASREWRRLAALWRGR